MTTYSPHTGYKTYRLPVFIAHVTEDSVTLVSELGEVRLRNLENLTATTHVIYSCLDVDTLLLYGDPTKWVVRSWAGRVSSVSYADKKIYLLGLRGFDESLFAFFTFLDSAGVAASSINTMSVNLWRATITRKVSFDEAVPQQFALGPVAVSIGGRKEARRGTYRNMVEYDIIAAYPNAMRNIPNSLMPAIGPVKLEDDSLEGIATANVEIPPQEWGPIPVVLDLASGLHCYGWTKVGKSVRVTLPLSELRLCAAAGCRVEILQCRLGIPPRMEGAFDRWIESVLPQLRGLPGTSGTLGKLVANRLWSTFAITDKQVAREHTFTADRVMQTRRVHVLEALTKRRSSTAYVGALISSRVRQRVFTEGLMHFPNVKYVDTDGVIAKPSLDIPAGWRVKTLMRSVDIAGTQALRYYCRDCLPPPRGHRGPHWTVAGASTLKAKSTLFEHLKRGGFLVTNIGGSIEAVDVTEYDQQADTGFTSFEALEALRPRGDRVTTG